MAHSDRLNVHWSLVISEIILFVFALISVYLSKTEKWSWFIFLSALSTIIFIIVKIFDAVPAARKLIIREDNASRMSIFAESSGVVDYFNMQSSSGQKRRNDITQQEIANAQNMWLCAISGASYLDPHIYRHWPAIEQRLKCQVNFRVVLLDPLSAEKQFRNKLNANVDPIDSKINLPSLIDLMNAYSTLEVRFAQFGMNSTVFATEHCLFFDPYHVGVINKRIDNRSFSLKISPTSPREGVGYYLLFKSHFDTLWRSSIGMVEWIEKSKDEWPTKLPNLIRH